MRPPIDAVIPVQVPPWNGYQNGDTLQILWGRGKEIVGSRQATEADADKALDVFVPVGAVRRIGQGTHDVYANVKNVLGLDVESAPTPVVVKLDIPGGLDPDSHTQYVNENLDPPVVEPATIGAIKSAKVTIPPYENMSVGDDVVVRWNVDGNDTAHDPLVTGDIGKPVEIDIDEDTIDAGGVGENLKVTYQILDAVRNWSLWSPHGTVDVPDPDAPRAPRVVPTVGNNGAILDLDALGSGDVKVFVEDSGVGAGETVKVHWAGTTASGQPVTFDTPARPAEQPNQTLQFDIPNRFAMPLAQGTVRAWYTIASTGGAERTSARRNLSVNGQATQLVRPSVDEAQGEVLDINRVPASGAHSWAPAWPGMQVGDDVEMVGDGRQANGDPLRWNEKQAVSGALLGKPVPFVIPREDILSLLNGSLRLYYIVTPFGTVKRHGTRQAYRTALLRSENLDLVVRDLSAPPLLDPPTVREAVDDVLDPDLYPTAHLDIPRYPGIASGDRVDMALRGGAVPFDDYALVLADLRPPSFILPNSVIEPNRNHVLAASYSVRPVGGESRPSQTRTFRIGTPADELDRPTVDEAPDHATIDPIAASNGLTVRVPRETSITPDDRVTVTLTGPGGTDTTAPQDGSSTGMTFNLSAGSVAPNLGRDIAIRYTVTPKAGGTSRLSPVLPLNVLDFQPNDGRVAKPFVEEAGGTFVLDLNTFAGNGTVRVPAWPLMARGQRFWLRAIAGTNVHVLANGDVIDAVGAFSRPLPRTWLDELADLATMTLQLKISYDGGTEATARIFTSNAYTVRAVEVAPNFPRPSVPEAVGGALPGDAPSATLRVAADAPLRQGDKVTGFFAGSDLGLKDATPGVAMNFAIPAAVIAANRGKTVTALYTVLRNAVTWNSDTLPIVVTDPAGEWDIEYDFDTDSIRHISVGQHIYFPDGSGSVMDMQFDWEAGISPNERLGVEAYEFEPGAEFSGNCLYIGYPEGISHANTVFFNFTEAWDVVRFAVTSVHRAVTVSFKDSSLNMISGVMEIPEGLPTRVTEVKYDDRGKTRIRHVELRCADVIRLDSFKFKRGSRSTETVTTHIHGRRRVAAKSATRRKP